VKNPAAFVQRYGTGRNIAGQYAGNLDNAGEHLLLLGALEEPILDFAYHDSWYPATDGLGCSLVVVEADGLHLRFLAAAGKSYRVQYRSALDSGNWQKLMDLYPHALAWTAEAIDPEMPRARDSLLSRCDATAALAAC